MVPSSGLGLIVGSDGCVVLADIVWVCSMLCGLIVCPFTRGCMCSISVQFRFLNQLISRLRAEFNSGSSGDEVAASPQKEKRDGGGGKGSGKKPAAKALHIVIVC